VHVVKRNRFVGVLVAAVGQEPTSGCVGENAMGKRGPDPDQSDGCKRIGGVFRPSEHRQSHLGYRRVTEFVQNDKQHVSDDEVHELFAIGCRQVLER
jgi:hypothetical protein